MPIVNPITFYGSTETGGGPSDVITTRALEQWFAADYGVTSSGGLISQMTSKNGTYNVTSSGTSRPTLATDGDGFPFVQFDGTSTNFTGFNQTMKVAGIEIANGAEWHGVFSFPTTSATYLVTLDPAPAEGRPSIRGYRGAFNNVTVFPESGGTGSPSLNAAYGTNKVVISMYRNVLTGKLAAGINGRFAEVSSSSATTLARGFFNWYNPNSGLPKCNFYEGCGYVDNLTTAERLATINALKAKYGIVSDPYYSSVSLLLHFDGANGSTTFTDSSPNALTVTASNATISTSNTMSGFGQVGDFNGASNCSLTVPANSVFNFGTGNFTIELWFNIPVGATGSPYGKSLISNENNSWGAGAFSLYGLASSTVFRPSFWIYEFSSSSPILIPSSGDYRDGNWHHLAIVRNGSSFAMHIDGTQVATGTHSGTCGLATRNVMIGDNLANNVGDRNLLGKLDEIRITNGVARTITVPTGPFPNS